mgnify:CR=1 FL=1
MNTYWNIITLYYIYCTTPPFYGHEQRRFHPIHSGKSISSPARAFSLLWSGQKFNSASLEPWSYRQGTRRGLWKGFSPFPPHTSFSFIISYSYNIHHVQYILFYFLIYPTDNSILETIALYTIYT